MKTITYTDYLDAENNMVGQCTACHARQGGCEPDARGYKCESCGALQVYGLEELVIMGEIEVTNTPPVVPMGDDNAYSVDNRKLQPFCKQHCLSNDRYHLGNPFWTNGRVCATDGKVAIRYAAKSKTPGNGKPVKVPRMAELPWKEDVQCNHRWPTAKELRGKERKTVFISSRTIAILYARKVARLGAVYYCLSGSPDDPLAFATSKLEGVLMPLAKQ